MPTIRIHAEAAGECRRRFGIGVDKGHIYPWAEGVRLTSGSGQNPRMSVWGCTLWDDGSYKTIYGSITDADFSSAGYRDYTFEKTSSPVPYLSKEDATPLSSALAYFSANGLSAPAFSPSNVTQISGSVPVNFSPSVVRWGETTPVRDTPIAASADLDIRHVVYNLTQDGITYCLAFEVHIWKDPQGAVDRVDYLAILDDSMITNTKRRTIEYDYMIGHTGSQVSETNAGHIGFTKRAFFRNNTGCVLFSTAPEDVTWLENDAEQLIQIGLVAPIDANWDRTVINGQGGESTFSGAPDTHSTYTYGTEGAFGRRFPGATGGYNGRGQMFDEDFFWLNRMGVNAYNACIALPYYPGHWPGGSNRQPNWKVSPLEFRGRLDGAVDVPFDYGDFDGFVAPDNNNVRRGTQSFADIDDDGINQIDGEGNFQAPSDASHWPNWCVVQAFIDPRPMVFELNLDCVHHPAITSGTAAPFAIRMPVFGYLDETVPDTTAWSPIFVEMASNSGGITNNRSAAWTAHGLSTLAFTPHDMDIYPYAAKLARHYSNWYVQGQAGAPQSWKDLGMGPISGLGNRDLFIPWLSWTAMRLGVLWDYLPVFECGMAWANHAAKWIAAGELGRLQSSFTPQKNIHVRTNGSISESVVSPIGKTNIDNVRRYTIGNEYLAPEDLVYEGIFSTPVGVSDPGETFNTWEEGGPGNLNLLVDKATKINIADGDIVRLQNYSFNGGPITDWPILVPTSPGYDGSQTLYTRNIDRSGARPTFQTSLSPNGPIMQWTVNSGGLA
ncbi:MAG: hypothetical protein AAFW46_18135, partial [Pseudomonadota bacterium]